MIKFSIKLSKGRYVATNCISVCLPPAP